MIPHLSIFIMLMTFLAGNQHAEKRLLLVFGIENNEQLVKEQSDILEKEKAGIQERDLEIIVIKNGDALYKKYKVQPGEFTVILIGNDKDEKLRTHELLLPEKLFAIIDGMPMRQAEMRKQKKQGR